MLLLILLLSKERENVKTNYTSNIRKIIENGIIEIKTREIQIESTRIYMYHRIGKEIVTAEKEDKIKYGSSYLKKLSKELTETYGKGYDYYNLTRMKNFYSFYPNVATVWQHFITWSHIKIILPIKNENKRNYYIKLVNDNNLSVRELRRQIKDNAFERLDNCVKENIRLEEKVSVFELIKDPLLLNIEESVSNISEKVLKKVILEKIESFLSIRI